MAETNMPQAAPHRFLFVVNPHAGGKDKTVWKEEIEAHFKNLPHSFTFLETTGKDDKRALEKEIKTHRPHRLIAIGGDGTLKLVAEVGAANNLIIGALPAGSANGMAAELGLPLAPQEALPVITGNHTAPLDAIRINGHYSIHLSDVGLNAQLIHHFEQTQVRGLWGYARQVLKTLRGGHHFRAKMTLDGKYVSHRAAMVIIANGRTYGTGVVINEHGNLHDGLFEVIVLRDVTIWGIMRSFFQSKSSTGIHQRVYCGKELVLKLPRPLPFQVDGEYMGTVRNVKAQILPQSVRILLPRKGLI